MNIQFGARLLIPLQPEHVEQLTKTVSDDGNAGVIEDMTGDSFLAVTANNGSDQAGEDQKTVIAAIKELCGLRGANEEKSKLIDQRSEERYNLIETITDELYAPHKGGRFTYRSDYMDQAIDSTKVRDFDKQVEEEAEAAIPVDFEQLQQTFTTLTNWVKQQFREFDGLYRDKNGIGL